MNTGQSMLAIGAMILLSLVVLRVNNSFLSTSSVMMESKFGVLATSLAQSMIEEASKMKFDQVDSDNPNYDMTSLTAPGALGPEGESHHNFNDFDDYNNYKDTVSNLPSAIYYISCSVCYVNAQTPDVVSNNRTWNKKITVTVTSPSSPDTVKLYSIFSYWFF